MTDQTTCPHCGAAKDVSFANVGMYTCGTTSGTVFTRQSLSCEIDSLHAKVAAQQELLKEAADSLRTLKHWAAIYSEYNHETLNACIDNAAEVLNKLEARE